MLDQINTSRADSHQLLTLDDSRAVQLWNLSSEERSVSTLTVLAQFLAGYRMAESGTTADAEADLAAKWEHCRRNVPQDFALTPEQIRRWHEQEAQASEAAKDWLEPCSICAGCSSWIATTPGCADVTKTPAPPTPIR